MSLGRRLDGAARPGLKDSDGVWRCRWCRGPCPDRKRSFCSDACIHEWRLRTDAGYVRAKLLERDHGVCRECGLDTLALRKHLREMPWELREALAAEVGIPRHRAFSSAPWDADHIRPVAEGGGECGLENFRTLCCMCHAKETAALARRRAEARRSARAPHEGRTTCAC